MRSRILSLTIFLALSPASVVRAQQWLPQNLGRWTAAPGAAEQPSILSADLAAETGLSQEARDYTSGSNKVHIVLQRFRDPSSAYEGYTAQLTTTLLPSSLGITSAVEKGKYILILMGNLVLRVEKPTDVSAEDLRLLVTTVEKHADKGPYPPIRSYLPEDNLVEGTQRYVLGPAGFARALEEMQLSHLASLTKEIGFESGAEAVLASYRRRNESATLVLIEYPTPQLAEQHLHHLEKTLPESAGQAGTKVERRTALLSVVFSPSSPLFAENLRRSVNYGTQVTWNEPTHSLTDPPWIEVLKTIFLGTFLFCVVAVILGIAFGGFRILIKRLFPGKVFDRPERLEVLQLGLSGKPINPKDLY